MNNKYTTSERNEGLFKGSLFQEPRPIISSNFPFPFPPARVNWQSMAIYACSGICLETVGGEVAVVAWQLTEAASGRISSVFLGEPTEEGAFSRSPQKHTRDMF